MGKNDIFIQTALINAYGRFDKVKHASNIFYEFDKMDNKNAVNMNAMMTVFVNHKMNENALSVYDSFEFLQNEISHNLALKACSNSFDFEKGKKIHFKLCNIDNIQINNTLIDFYGNCRDIKMAKKIFDDIAECADSVSINNMIKALVHDSNDTILNELAIQIYEEYHHLNNDISHVLVLRACKNTSNVKKGKEIHKKIKCMNQYIASALIDFYGNFKKFDDAQ